MELPAPSGRTALTDQPVQRGAYLARAFIFAATSRHGCGEESPLSAMILHRQVDLMSRPSSSGFQSDTLVLDICSISSPAPCPGESAAPMPPTQTLSAPHPISVVIFVSFGSTIRANLMSRLAISGQPRPGRTGASSFSRRWKSREFHVLPCSLRSLLPVDLPAE